MAGYGLDGGWKGEVCGAFMLSSDLVDLVAENGGEVGG